MERTEFILNKDFLKGIANLSKFGLSYDLLVLEHQLPATIELVKKFPKQRFVLDHMAKPQISEGVSRQWMNNIHELGKCRNVYCKLSGFFTETENFRWSSGDFSSFLKIVIDAFGEDKLMFGSD